MNLLSPLEAQSSLTKPDTCLLDVRTAVEFREKHIPGSRHIPVDELAARSGELDPAQHHVLVCHSGKRAERAREILAKSAFHDLSLLEGGVVAWEEGHLPLERSRRRILPLMRQVQLVIGVLALTGSVLAIAINPWFALIPAFLGAGLTMAGTTGWCGLAHLLAAMPWNRDRTDSGPPHASPA